MASLTLNAPDLTLSKNPQTLVPQRFAAFSHTSHQKKLIPLFFRKKSNCIRRRKNFFSIRDVFFLSQISVRFLLSRSKTLVPQRFPDFSTSHLALKNKCETVNKCEEKSLNILNLKFLFSVLKVNFSIYVF